MLSKTGLFGELPFIHFCCGPQLGGGRGCDERGGRFGSCGESWAREAAVDEDALEDAIDADDPKDAVIALLLKMETAPLPASAEFIPEGLPPMRPESAAVTASQTTTLSPVHSAPASRTAAGRSFTLLPSFDACKGTPAST